MSQKARWLHPGRLKIHILSDLRSWLWGTEWNPSSLCTCRHVDQWTLQTGTAQMPSDSGGEKEFMVWFCNGILYSTEDEWIIATNTPGRFSGISAWGGKKKVAEKYRQNYSNSIFLIIVWATTKLKSIYGKTVKRSFNNLRQWFPLRGQKGGLGLRRTYRCPR